MIKFKHLFCTVFLSALLYSCGSDSNTIVKFDHEAQALKDKDSIAKFLDNYYFDDTIDSIKPLVSGKTPLSGDARLIKKTHIENEISYDLYHIITKEGESTKQGASSTNITASMGSPTPLDSVFTKYQVWYTSKTSEYALSQTGGAAIWWNLTASNSPIAAPSPIRGWSLGIPNFKGGILKKDPITGNPINGPITYEKFGKGILIIPSGLAYAESTTGNIPANSQLVFYIDLLDFVKNTDHDQDGVFSILEDVDENGDSRNDDTDKDRIANYLDVDDDGDGILTKNEDANGDGDPTNDFSDPNKPTVPDYLNRDIRK
ncbi:FKBP-type peptidyl-prolyl cis-trans isomerase [Tenacibaculum ovolyticum]|uniref:FKBP-type peptidyl-prolyl cis-trans isomerase n=1 Tax=Tenacibaculum ovolyticum TaxID=104270 RepID=UPI003BACE3CC